MWVLMPPSGRPGCRWRPATAGVSLTVRPVIDGTALTTPAASVTPVWRSKRLTESRSVNPSGPRAAARADWIRATRPSTEQAQLGDLGRGRGGGVRCADRLGARPGRGSRRHGVEGAGDVQGGGRGSVGPPGAATRCSPTTWLSVATVLVRFSRRKTEVAPTVPAPGSVVELATFWRSVRPSRSPRVASSTEAVTRRAPGAVRWSRSGPGTLPSSCREDQRARQPSLWWRPPARPADWSSPCRCC